MTRRRSNDTDEGAIAIVAAVVVVPLALMLAVTVDVGRVWVDRERLRTGVEAAAMASAAEWSRTGTMCSSHALGFVSSDGASPRSVTCSKSGQSTSGVMTVAAQEDVPLLFATLLGRNSAAVKASTSVRIGAAQSVTRLWPFGLCVDNPAIARWISGGMVAGVSERITFEAPNQKCGGDVSGNWALLDFNGGSNPTGEVEGWIQSGYEGYVKVGDIVSGSPGAPSTSLNLGVVVGKSIRMPLYSEPRMQGANAVYKIVGFAQAVVEHVQSTGASSQRSITIRFERGTTSGSTGIGPGGNYGLVAWSVCSFDSYGVCG